MTVVDLKNVENLFHLGFAISASGSVDGVWRVTVRYA